MNEKAFRITMGKGFQITFPNGITISTQFGFGNYCENLTDNTAISYGGEVLSENYSGDVNCNDCEIAVFSKDGDWITKDALIGSGVNVEPYDDVEGYVKIDNWLKIFNWCQNQ